MSRLFAVLVVALLAVAFARADVAPPPGKKVIPVTTVVEATESFPDYAFFESGSRTYYGSPAPPTKEGPPPEPPGWRTDSWATRVDVSPGQRVSRTGGRRDGATLFAIPKAAAAARPDANELLRAARANKVPGSAFIPFGVTREIPTSDPRTEITVRYRVARTPAGVAFVDADDAVPPGDVLKCGNDGPEESTYEVAGRAVPWRWVAAGGASSLALVLAGVWFVLRSRKG